MTTVAELFYGSHENARSAIAEGLDGQGLDLSSLAGHLVPNMSVASALADLFGLRLGAVAARAWADHEEIKRAVARTRDKSGERETIHLGPHTVKADYRPKIELEVNGVSKPIPLEVRLVLELEVQTMTATIENGTYTTSAGQAEVSGQLKIGSVSVVEKQLLAVGLDESETERVAT